MSTMIKQGNAYCSAIRTARIEKGMTQVELARAIGVKNSSISYWERGRCVPSQTHRRRLKRVLGIDPVLFDTYKGDVVAKLVCSTRTELELTKTRLAAMSGISAPTIRRLERTGCCQAPVLAKIVAALVSYAKARRMTQIVPVELVEIACNRMRRYRAIEQNGQTTSMC